MSAAAAAEQALLQLDVFRALLYITFAAFETFNFQLGNLKNHKPHSLKKICTIKTALPLITSEPPAPKTCSILTPLLASPN